MSVGRNSATIHKIKFSQSTQTSSNMCSMVQWDMEMVRLIPSPTCKLTKEHSEENMPWLPKKASKSTPPVHPIPTITVHPTNHPVPRNQWSKSIHLKTRAHQPHRSRPSSQSPSSSPKPIQLNPPQFPNHHPTISSPQIQFKSSRNRMKMYQGNIQTKINPLQNRILQIRSSPAASSNLHQQIAAALPHPNPALKLLWAPARSGATAANSYLAAFTRTQNAISRRPQPCWLTLAHRHSSKFHHLSQHLQQIPTPIPTPPTHS